MELTIHFPDNVKGIDYTALKKFVQGHVYAYVQGHCRYGRPAKDKRYMSRLELELRAYKKTGNAEHLRNISVYAGLEIEQPEHKKFHFNPTVGSVTRGKV